MHQILKIIEYKHGFFYHKRKLIWEMINMM